MFGKRVENVAVNIPLKLTTTFYALLRFFLEVMVIQRRRETVPFFNISIIRFSCVRIVGILVLTIGTCFIAFLARPTLF